MGKGKEPKDPADYELVASRLATIKGQCGIFDYVPHEKQRIFHEAKCKIKLFQGGNQSGKTTCAIVEMLEWALGVQLHNGEPKLHPITGEQINPAHLRMAYEVDDFVNKVGEVIIAKIKELVPWDAVVVKADRIQGGAIHKLTFYTGATLKFLSYDQKVNKHEGFTWDAVFFDEPPPRWAFIAAFRGTMRRNSPMFFAMTPISEPWIQEELVENPCAQRLTSYDQIDELDTHSYLMVEVSLYEIDHLPEEEKEAFINSLTEEEKAARVYGRALHLQGRVFKSYTDRSRQFTDERLEEISAACGVHWSEWPWGQIVDPHDRRPYAVLWFVVSPRDEIMFVREWPEFDFYSVKNCQNKVDDYVAIFEELEAATFVHPPSWRRMDPRFGRTPKATTNTTLQEEFAARGLVYDCDFTDDQLLETGHHKINKRLDDDQILVHESCFNLHKAFLNYVRDDHVRDDGSKPAKEGKTSVKEKHKDFIDCVRYCLEDNVEWHEPFRGGIQSYELPPGGMLGRRF